jgi:hypothetical protein
MDGTVTYRRPPSEGKFNVIECIYNRIQFKAEIKNFFTKIGSSILRVEPNTV